MAFIDLIVLVCAISNPSACREEHILFQSAGSLESCMMRAQPYLAQWAGEHPALQIRRWRCAWPETEARDI